MKARSRAARNRRSTSSSSAIGWKRPVGTKTARRRSCRPTSSKRPGPNTSRPAKGSPAKSFPGSEPPGYCPLSLVRGPLLVRWTPEEDTRMAIGQQDVDLVLEQLERGPRLVISVIKEIPPALRKRRPAPGVWSAHEHAVHLP